MNLIDILEAENFNFGLSQFLEEFRFSSDPYEMISKEPIGDYDSKKLCILAAVAHKLANERKIEVPGWVIKDKYISAEPIYSFDTKNEAYQEFLRKDSPEEFAQKNVFWSSKALTRV